MILQTFGTHLSTFLSFQQHVQQTFRLSYAALSICSQQNDSLIKLSIRFRIKHCYCICEFCHQINKIRIIFANNQSSKIFIIFFIINNLRKKEIFIMFCINAKPKMEKTMPHFLHSIPRFTNIKKSRFIFRKEFFNYSQNSCSHFTVTR